MGIFLEPGRTAVLFDSVVPLSVGPEMISACRTVEVPQVSKIS